MVVKRYTGNNITEVMAKIKSDMGGEALIVSQRKVRKQGLWGLFSSRLIEITAAKEEKARDDVNLNTTPSYYYKRMGHPHDNSDKTEEILRELQKLKSSIDESKEKESPFRKMLRELDLSDELIEEIINTVKEGDITEEKAQKSLPKLLKPYLSVSSRELKGNVVLVGPTGVGKTTTIAKLAGRLSLIDKKSVGLITVDTYRIGAVEQLKTYAEIMNIPFKVVVTLKDMEEAVKELSHCDVVLIDTTGRSSKNSMQISELRAFIDKSKSKDIHLVISAGTKDKDVVNIIEAYRTLAYTRLIVTKLDETMTYGVILSIANAAKVPVSYITSGQNVPEDIQVPTKDKLVRLILKEDNLC
ncbi:MAG: flagellar biosynthesis protein FlhF [Clostridiaceae bacterium]